METWSKKTVVENDENAGDKAAHTGEERQQEKPHPGTSWLAVESYWTDGSSWNVAAEFGLADIANMRS